MREIEKITSRDNQRLVYTRKVREGKFTEQIFIEGRRLADEALRSDIIIDNCIVADDFYDDGTLDAIAKRGVSIAAVPNKIFASIADTKQPQGIILIAKRPTALLETVEASLRESVQPIAVFLKEINNPSNLGAILRTVEAAGAVGVLVSNDSADVFSPRALRAAMGATFRLPIVENANFHDMVHWAKTTNITTTATAASAVKSYVEIDWKKPRLLIFGSEAHGLSNLELEQIDEAISIPMANDVESLNLAVSAGIILFEAKRQNS